MLGVRTTLAFTLGVLVGAVSVGLGDPASGRRRRARVRDRSRHESRRARRTIGRRWHYERGRIRGVAHDAAVRSHLEHEEPLPDYDETLVDKIRSEAFRDSRHELQQINLSAAQGVVHVFGSAQGRPEAEDILARVRRVRGVGEVVDHLVIREPQTADG